MKNYSSKLMLSSLMLFALASCKNSSSIPPHDLLVGKWKAHTLVDEKDTSGMVIGTLDKENILFTFNGDGTGVGAGGFDDPLGKIPAKGGPFTWVLSNNNTYLNLANPKSKNTVSFKIVALTENKFTIKDTSEQQAVRMTLVKL